MILSLLIFSVVILKVSNSAPYSGKKEFSYGLEAERLCKAYRKVCPRNKICVIQHLVWPRKMSFPVCVHEKRLPVKSKVCELPPAPGRCAARFRRWYFNVHAGKCSWFTYGGCDGNLNNFRSEDACQAACYTGNMTDVAPAANSIVSVPDPRRRVHVPAIRATPSAPFTRRPSVRPPRPAVLSHPAPIMMKSDLREALEGDLKPDMEDSGDRPVKMTRPKNKRKHRKGKGKRKGGKRRKHRKSKKQNATGPYAELRVRKTSYRSEKAQNDQGEGKSGRKHRKRNKVRRRHRGYYNNIRLFRLLASRDNPQGISLG